MFFFAATLVAAGLFNYTLTSIGKYNAFYASIACTTGFCVSIVISIFGYYFENYYVIMFALCILGFIESSS